MCGGLRCLRPRPGRAVAVVVKGALPAHGPRTVIFVYVGTPDRVRATRLKHHHCRMEGIP